MESVTLGVEERFTNVRKKLDQLGYRQPLSVEALPLAERLLADLVWTTEHLRKAKQEDQKKVEVKGQIEEYTEPYKNDNARLIKENNDFHKEILDLKQKFEAENRDLQTVNRRVESENEDLKFFNSQCLNKLKQLEEESKRKTDKILQLQERNFQAVVQTNTGKKKPAGSRRQRMELDDFIAPSQEKQNGLRHPAGVRRQQEDVHVVDLVKASQRRIDELSREVQRWKDESEIHERKVANLKQQVALREEEIGRLRNLCEGGRPYEVVSMESKSKSTERLLNQQGLQIDLLQSRNRELELELGVLQNKLNSERRMEIDLDIRNQRLSGELVTVDRMAQRLETEKEVALRQADSELSEAKLELERSRQQMMQLDEKLCQLETDRKRLQDSVNETKRAATQSTLDNKDLNDLIIQQQNDKKRLTQRVEKLTANERELVLEIERLKRNKTNNHKKTSNHTKSEVEQYFKGIEQDRDYWKHEAEQIAKMLRTTNGSRGASPVRISRTPSKPRSASPIKSKSTLKSPIKDSKKTNGHVDTMMKLLEDEKDHYKREYEMLKTRGISPSRARARSPPTRDRVSSDDSELLRIKRERDELQTLLDKFERHMGEIQGNVRVLTQERDQLNKMLDEARDELHRVRRELLSSPSQPKVSLAAQAVLKRVETERDDAFADLRRMMTERDSLRERLKVSTETALNDKARLEQRIEDIQNAARKATAERDDYGTRASTLRQRCAEMEDQLKNLHRNLSEKQDELAQERANHNQQRLHSEAGQRQCKQLEADLIQAQDAAALLQDRCFVMEKELKNLRDDHAQMRSTINNLDYEKDSLESAVHERSDRLRALEEDLKAKEQQITDLRTQVHHAEYQLSRVQDQLSGREKELRTAKKQQEGVQGDLAAEQRRGDNLQRETARLQDDLQLMTRENHSLQAELQDTAEERESFRTKCQDYLQEVRRVEELLGQKEQERSDLLEQYRILSSESDRYQTQCHQLESEASNLKLEMMAKDADIKRLRERLEGAEADMQEARHTINSYELQVSNLTRSVSDLEDSLRQQQYERDEVLKDLSALRDLCSKLESSKDHVQRQLTSKALDGEQLASQLDDLQHENDLLREQVCAEQDAKKSLETVLSASREKEFQTQLDVQERSAELGMLKDRMDLSETKLEQQARELTRLRSRNGELETEVERLTRQLTSERFERERLAQELRRSGNFSAGLYGSHGTLNRSDSRSRDVQSEQAAPQVTALSNSLSQSTGHLSASGGLGRTTRQESTTVTYSRSSLQQRSNMSPSRSGILKSPTPRSHSPAPARYEDY